MMMDFFRFNWMILVIGVILLMVAIVYLAPRLGRRGGREDRPGKDPLEIINERYARGEISREEFERLKKDLE